MFIDREKSRIRKRMSYKEMEAEILAIFEERKRKAKAAILNSLFKFSIGAVGKNLKEAQQTPRFGSKILAMMEEIDKKEENPVVSSSSSSSPEVEKSSLSESLFSLTKEISEV